MDFSITNPELWDHFQTCLGISQTKNFWQFLRARVPRLYRRYSRNGQGVRLVSLLRGLSVAKATTHGLRFSKAALAPTAAHANSQPSAILVM